MTNVICQSPFQALMADAVHGLGDTAAEVARSSAPNLPSFIFVCELREGNQKAETKAERVSSLMQLLSAFNEAEKSTKRVEH